MKNLINSYFSVQTTQNKKQNPDPQHLHQTHLFVCGVGVGRGGNIFSRNQPRDTAILAPSSLAEMCQTRKQCMVASEPRSKLNKMFKIQRNNIEFNSLLKKHLLDDVKESYTGTCSRLLCPQCHLNLN